MSTKKNPGNNKYYKIIPYALIKKKKKVNNHKQITKNKVYNVIIVKVYVHIVLSLHNLQNR